MVDYNPRGESPSVHDMTEEENYKLKAILNNLFTMIIRGSALSDIQRYAAKAASDVDWPFLPSSNEEEE